MMYPAEQIQYILNTLSSFEMYKDKYFYIELLTILKEEPCAIRKLKHEVILRCERTFKY